VNVPKVVGMSPSDVRGALAAMPLQLATDPKEPADTMTSTKQDPQAHQLVPFGTTVTVTFEPPAAPAPAQPVAAPVPAPAGGNADPANVPAPAGVNADPGGVGG
jgi:hypothetical protein